MPISHLLLLFFVGQLIPTGHALNTKYLPIATKILQPWVKLNITTSMCPNITYSQPHILGSSISGARYVGAADIKIEGQLCTTIKLTTRCYVNFLGHEEVDFIESTYPASQSLCFEAIKKKNIGSYIIPNYPPKECYWLQEKEITTYVEHLSSHFVTYDPYQNVLRDSLFPDFRCNSNPCNTIYNDRLWISTSNDYLSCQNKSLVTATLIETISSTLIQTGWWSPDFFIKSNDLGCISNFCGQFGIKFSTGEWIKLPDDVVAHYSNTKPPIIPYCDNPFHVSIPDETVDRHYREKLLMSEMESSTCEAFISRLLSEKHIIELELQYLNPRYPGVHPIFKIKEGIVWTSLAEYKNLRLDSISLDNHPVFLDSNGEKELAPGWNMRKFGSYLGPNGLYIQDGRMIYYLHETQLFTAALHIENVTQVIVSHWDNKPKIPIEEQILIHEGESESVRYPVISHKATSIWIIIGCVILTFILCYFGMVIILNILIKVRKLRNKPTSAPCDPESLD